MRICSVCRRRAAFGAGISLSTEDKNTCLCPIKRGMQYPIKRGMQCPIKRGMQGMEKIMKSLIIAEKPSVARDIARVMKCGKAGNGYLEGGQYIVTWGLGHLVELADPE